VHDGVPYTLKHGDVIMASITSCTNATSSLAVFAAGISTILLVLYTVSQKKACDYIFAIT